MTLPNPPTLRQRQAQATRGAIVAAARRLFAQHGYVETSVVQIAEEAGVAVQTVYKSMGTKAAILMELVEAIDEEAEVPALGAGIASATDPAEIVRAGVKLTRQISERCGDIVRALASAAIARGRRGSRAACTRSARCARGSPRRGCCASERPQRSAMVKPPGSTRARTRPPRWVDRLASRPAAS